MSKKDTYNTDLYGMKRRREERSFIGVLLNILLLTVTIALSVVLLLAYFTPLISPAKFGSMTIMGIFAPAIYISVVMLALLWVVMRRWRIAGVLALVLLPGLFLFSDFYRIDISREIEPERDRRAFTVMSYNVRGFMDEKFRHNLDNFIERYAEEPLPDIACFQEYKSDARDIELIDELFEGYHKRMTTESGNLMVCTFSRYPIIATGEISGENRGTSQWCDVVIRRDTVRVFNNHLYTTSITSDDSEQIADGRILRDGSRMASIVDRIASNSAIRAEHVDTLRTVIDATPYRHIVCGDFNDTPMSYVYRRMSHNLKDAFKERGRGYGYTFRPLHGILRIDYILYSDGLEAQHYYIDEEAEMSDHLPVLTRLNLL